MAAQSHKGYLSFVIAFFGVLIAAAAHQMAVSTQQFDYSESITILKMHSLEMNVREVVKELARFGVKQADEEILIIETARRIKQPPEPPLSTSEKEEIYKRHILEQLKKLDSYSFSDEFDVKVGCGEDQKPFGSLECTEIINLKISTFETGSLKEIGELKFSKPQITYRISTKQHEIEIRGEFPVDLEILTERMIK